MTARVLLVDDEPRLLDGLRRNLRSRFEITTAPSGAAGLAAVEEALLEGNPFAVIVSDMMMPEMNGAEFLAKARVVAPDVVMMVLSGQADLNSTIQVVNSANLFRFLTKPCEPERLAQALSHALRQHELIHSERQLLERTLGGTVSVLTDVLSMASPAASRRTARVRAFVDDVAHHLGVENDWRLPIAAMLSHIGCIAVPGHVLEKIETGDPLTTAELEIYERHPSQGAQLLQRIPRLEEISTWIGHQPIRLPATCDTPIPPSGDVIHQILEAVSLFLLHHDLGHPLREGLQDLAGSGRYPAALIEAVGAAATNLQPRGTRQDLPVADLRSGMVIQADVLTKTGQILVRQGEHLNTTLITRLKNFCATIGVIEPIAVLVDSTIRPGKE